MQSIVTQQSVWYPGWVSHLDHNLYYQCVNLDSGEDVSRLQKRYPDLGQATATGSPIGRDNLSVQLAANKF